MNECGNERVNKWTNKFVNNEWEVEKINLGCRDLSQKERLFNYTDGERGNKRKCRWTNLVERKSILWIILQKNNFRYTHYVCQTYLALLDFQECNIVSWLKREVDNKESLHGSFLAKEYKSRTYLSLFRDSSTLLDEALSKRAIANYTNPLNKSTLFRVKFY